MYNKVINFFQHLIVFVSALKLKLILKFYHLVNISRPNCIFT